MKEEKEVRWIVNLLISKEFSNTWLSKKGGSIFDFEKCANDSSHDKEFSRWFKWLVDTEIITFSEYRDNSKGSPTKVYLLNKDKLFKYLKGIDFYIKFKKAIDDNVIV